MSRRVRAWAESPGVSLSLMRIRKSTEVDLSEYLTPGVNQIELTLVNNLRNLLGPHHLEEGESYSVGPFSFFKGYNMWSWTGKPVMWNDGYCFVETSVLE